MRLRNEGSENPSRTCARHRSTGGWFYPLEMLTVLGGLAELERELIRVARTARAASEHRSVAFASDAPASSPRISVMRRCSASGKAKHRRTSPGATPSIRPPSADWQLPALSSTAWPSPSEALGSALRPRSPGVFPASARGLLTPHRLSSEGDTMNIRLTAATEHPWPDGADGVAARAPCLSDLPGFF